MLKTGEAQSLAKDVISKAGFERHAAGTGGREKAVSAEAFEGEGGGEGDAEEEAEQ